jgi:hypothetical protein
LSTSRAAVTARNRFQGPTTLALAVPQTETGRACKASGSASVQLGAL